MLPVIKDICIDHFEAYSKWENPDIRKNHFDFFGFDFMCDEDFRVYLLECNINPGMDLVSKHALRLIPLISDEIIQITVDPYYPPTL